MLFLFYEYKLSCKGKPNRLYTKTKESVEECTRYTFDTLKNIFKNT